MSKFANTFDHDLIGKLLGGADVDREAPLAPLLRDLNTPFSGPNGPDRLRYFTEELLMTLETAIVTPQDPEAILTAILLNFDRALPGYRTVLSRELRPALELRILEQLTKSGIWLSSQGETDNDPVRLQACALGILEQFNAIFEAASRQGVDQDSPLGDSTGMIDAPALASSDKALLRTRDFFRWVLWFGPAYTSWEGFCRVADVGVDWLKANNHLVGLNASTASVIDGIVGVGIAGLITEGIRQGKKEVELVGCSEGLNLPRALISAARANRIKTGLLVGAMALDVYTNVEGIMEFTYGQADVRTQIADVRGKIETHKQDITNAIQDSRDKGLPSTVGIAANQALIDEASGLFSLDDGMGPRFYGLAAVYFGSATIKQFTWPDARCEVALSETLYGGGTIYELADESWCVHGPKDEYSWIVGNAAGGRDTARDALGKHSSSPYKQAVKLADEFQRTHPRGYISEMDAAWDAYLDSLSDMTTVHFATVDGVVQAWDPDSTNIPAPKEDLDKSINPAFAAAEAQRQQLFSDTNTLVQSLTREYTDFDRQLVAELDPNGRAVDIPTVKLPIPEFSFPQIDMSEDLEVRTFYGKAISAIERNPANLGPIGLLLLVAAAFSYFDMAFYHWVRKSYNKDLDHIRVAFEAMQQQMTSLLTALYTHFNRGPFRTLYGEPGAVEPIPESFLRERLQGSLEGLTTCLRYDTVERGLVYGLVSNSWIKGTRGQNHHTFGEEWRGFWEHLSERSDSPVIRAFNRLRLAADDYLLSDGVVEGSDSQLLTEPTRYEELFMTFKDGAGPRFGPADVLKGMFDARKGKNPEDFSHKFRREILRRISGAGHMEKKHEPLAEHMGRLSSEIQTLRGNFNVHDEETVLRVFVVGEEVQEVTQKTTLTQAEERRANALIAEYQELVDVFVNACSAFEAEVDGASRQMNAEAKAEEESRETAIFLPQFTRLEQELAQQRYVLSSSGHRDGVNPYKLEQALVSRRGAVQDIKARINVLSPKAGELRMRKGTLLEHCAAVDSELEVSLSTFRRDVLPDILRKRGWKIMGWVNNNLQTVTLDLDAATLRLTEFAHLYNELLRGNPNFVELQDGGQTDFVGVQNALNHLCGELNANPGRFGWDAGMFQALVPVTSLGASLKAAFTIHGQALNAPLQVTPKGII